MTKLIDMKFKMTCSECGYIDRNNINGARFTCTYCGHEIHVDENGLNSYKKYGKPKEDKRKNDKFEIIKGPGDITESGSEVKPERVIESHEDVKNLKVGDRILHHKKYKRKCPRKMWEES